MTMVKRYYVIQNRNGKFFKKDNSSGDYPSFVDSIECCEKFGSEKYATKFLNGKYVTEKFAIEFDEAKVKKVTIIVE